MARDFPKFVKPPSVKVSKLSKNKYILSFDNFSTISLTLQLSIVEIILIKYSSIILVLINLKQFY